MEKNIKSTSIGLRCELHQHCNLQCKFCFETDNGVRKNNTINIDYIKDLPNQIMDTISKDLENPDIDVIKIVMMGGELFSDDIPDEIFDVYSNFCYDIRTKLNGRKIQFIAMSNGVFTKYDRVEKFLKEFNCIFSLGYDPCDRFHNDHQKQMWFNTYQYFKERFHIAVSTVLTKKNIDAYIAGDEIFEKVGNKVFISAHEYSPRWDYHEYLASDEDYYNFYKWAIDNEKFNFGIFNLIIKAFVSNTFVVACTTGSDYTFSENSTDHSSNVCMDQFSLSKEEYYGDLSDKILDHDCLKNKQPLGVIKRGCLYCEYHGKCTAMCWVQILFKEYRITECPIKRIYQYIENNPSVIDKYKHWRCNNEEYRNLM